VHGVHSPEAQEIGPLGFIAGAVNRATPWISAACAPIKKEAARLRKRFQLVKENIFELGRREGLFEGTPEDR
jgi:hypothetical protein